MDNIIEKKINIEKFSDEGKLIRVIDGKDKYTLWKLKKDETTTKAFEQWEQYGFKTGQTVEAGVKEEPSSFENEAGKTINFVNRTIMFFKVSEDGIPHVNDTKETPKIDVEDLIATAIEAHERDYHDKAGVEKSDLPY